MRYHVLATDYDGTLAPFEKVTPDTIEYLKKLKESGRKLILVTGRQLQDLIALFPEHILFDRIVAENGASIYSPATLEERLLGIRPPDTFVNKLRELQIEPLEVGRVIVSTWQPHHTTVLNAIREAGLELQVIFNKGAVMILPPGINKSSGLHEALKDLLLSEHNTVAVGDAENDHAMLHSAELAVAVQNALQTLKTEADLITENPFNGGVIEVIAGLLKDDLAALNPQRHYLQLGIKSDSTSFSISPYGNTILVVGQSCCGKSTFTSVFLEQLVSRHYQFCLIDPEGDYPDLPGAVTMGDDKQPPVIPEMMKVLHESVQNVVICVLAIPFHDRPAFFKKILMNISDLYRSTGRPHFLVMDEAHHLISSEQNENLITPNKDLPGLFAVTTEAKLIHKDFLSNVDMVITMGPSPEQAVAAARRVIGMTTEIPKDVTLQKGEILVWEKKDRQLSFVRTAMPKNLRRCHKRKYASGNLGMDSFYFTGPERKLNIQASNLMMFVQIANGIDLSTWIYHLHRNDYSKWFRGSIKDEELAWRTESIENTELQGQVSRAMIVNLILKRYTGPADSVGYHYATI